MTDDPKRPDDPEPHEDRQASDGEERRRPTPVRRSVEDAGAGGSGRPVPVRKAMEAEREPREPVAKPRTEIDVDDETWIVRVEGRSVTGRPPDAGAPLLLLTFARGEEPDRRLREVLAVGRSLEALHPDELRRLLDRSRPFESEWERTEIFPHTSRDRGR